MWQDLVNGFMQGKTSVNYLKQRHKDDDVGTNKGKHEVEKLFDGL